MESQSIQVMIVYEQIMVRKGLKLVLEEFGGIRVAGEACNGLHAIELVERLDPDVILMDLGMRVADGIEATKRILAIRPYQQIILMTDFLDGDRLVQVIKAGAKGCVDKTISPEELVQAIHDVCSGKPSFSASIAWGVLRRIDGAKTPPPKHHLSKRENQILRLLTLGKLDEEIAGELFLTRVTVRTHISRILEKLGLENRVQAALYGLRSGLVSTSELSATSDAWW
jgi:two-component system, NarL family, response regulator LiaR